MNRSPLLTVSHFPFRRTYVTFSRVQYALILMLLPAAMYGCSLYGLFAARILAASVFFFMLWDTVFETIAGKKHTLHDGSAALAGLLFGMLLLPETPWWIIAVGSGAAQFLGKQLFGGAGGSPFNAVCIGWAVVTISWPVQVDLTFGSVGFTLPFSSMFPLAELHRAGNEVLSKFPAAALFRGLQAGGIGSGAIFLLFIGGCIGMLLRIIPWRIPLSFFAGEAVAALLVKMTGVPFSGGPLFHILTGYSCIAAFFIATDLSSRPVSSRVMLLYGTLIGILTVVFRVLGKFPEGLPFAILVVNIIIPLFDRGASPAVADMPEVVRL